MLKNISLNEFGYNFLGPFLSTYITSVCQKINQMPNDVKVFHLAREGYAIKQAFSIVDRNTTSSEYLYVSRTFLFRITLDLESSWQFSVKHGFSGSMAEFFKARYAFTQQQLDSILSIEESEVEINLPEDYADVCELLNKKREVISNLISSTRNTYLEYLASINFTDSEITPVVLDVGYSGTIQKLLTILTNRDVSGIYMITTQSGSEKINHNTAHIHHVFKTDVKMGGGYKVLDRSMFLEALLTAPNGQFVDIIKNKSNSEFHFCFGRRTYTQENFNDLDMLLSGALDCVKDCHTRGLTYSTTELETLFEAYVSQRNLLPRATWPLFVLDDAVSGQGNLNPLDFFGL